MVRSAPTHDGTLVIKGIGAAEINDQVFLELLVKVKVVPTLIQNALLDLASVILGVAVAWVPWRPLMSMEQGEEAEPQVFVSAQMLAGLDTQADVGRGALVLSLLTMFVA